MANVTNITSINTLQSAADYVSTGTGGLFWVFVIIGLFMILVINLRKNGIENALITASFASLTMSLFMLYYSWINLTIPILFGLLTAGVIFYKIFTGRQ